ncbi:MAG: LysM peptidoglycan-binding domain-containing protein [Chloroflexi bacterium]|nr:LysM peptidoglycan-binding domain-containing protein [Chloroflexota bacterium]
MRRVPIGYILLTVIVTLAVTFGAMTSSIRAPQSEPEQIVITVPIPVTATPNPDASPQVIVDGHLPAGHPGRGQPADRPAGDGQRQLCPHAARTGRHLDPTIVAGGGELLASTAAALPPNCVLHTLAEGDTPFAVAEQYGVNGFDLLAVNGLTEETSVFLQIGETLIIPLEGCELTAAALEAAEAATALLFEYAGTDGHAAHGHLHTQPVAHAERHAFGHAAADGRQRPGGDRPRGQPRRAHLGRHRDLAITARSSIQRVDSCVTARAMSTPSGAAAVPGWAGHGVHRTGDDTVPYRPVWTATPPSRNLAIRRRSPTTTGACSPPTGAVASHPCLLVDTPPFRPEKGCTSR